MIWRQLYSISEFPAMLPHILLSLSIQIGHSLHVLPSLSIQIGHSCDVCNKKLATRKSLRDHKRLHTGERPFECATCGASFRTESLLRSHRRQHAARLQCGLCGETSRSEPLLSVHRRTYHPELELLRPAEVTAPPPARGTAGTAQAEQGQPAGDEPQGSPLWGRQQGTGDTAVWTAP